MSIRKIVYECGCEETKEFQTCPIHNKKILKIFTFNRAAYQRVQQYIAFCEVIKPIRKVQIEGTVK